jgi:hypothetical protein
VYRITRVTFFSLVVAASSAAVAQDDAQDADAIARKLSNPAAANWSIGNNFDFIKHTGDLPEAGEQTSFVYLLQAAMPKKLSSGNILFRPGLPILISQTVPSADGFETISGLGDLGFDLAYGSTDPNTGILYFVGVVGTVPTNTQESIPNLWSFGPEAAIGIVKKWGVVGVLASQQWDLSGGPHERSVGGGQYFYAFSLGGGWQLAAGPTFSYNWVGRDLSLPVAAGLAKTVILGATPLKIFGQVWYYVAKPETFGQDWSVRLTVSPVIKGLW